MLSQNLKIIGVGGTIGSGRIHAPLKVWMDNFRFDDSESEKVSEHRPTTEVNTITMARLPISARIVSIKIMHDYKDVSIDVGVVNQREAFVDGFDSNQGEVSCNVGNYLGRELRDVDRISNYQTEVDIIVTLTGVEIKGGLSILIEYT